MSKSPVPAKTARVRASSGGQDSTERVIVSVSLERGVLRRLDVLARQQARSRSSQIALLVRQWVEAQS